MTHSIPALHISQSRGARVEKLAEAAWRLEIPAGAQSGYRLAQLDEHGSLRRRDFPWQPPLTLHLQARISARELPGTWGFGLWNDPFSALISYSGIVPRLPALPEAAWFFHASPHNHLSFRDDLPASGFLAATFHSREFPSLILAMAAPLMTLSLVPGLAHWVRRLLRCFIHQDAESLDTDETEWHAYHMEWEADKVRFSLDGVETFQTEVSPRGPLSLVIWVDNQYAALPPRGRFRYGRLPNPQPAWMEIKEFSIQRTQ